MGSFLNLGIRLDTATFIVHWFLPYTLDSWTRGLGVLVGHVHHQSCPSSCLSVSTGYWFQELPPTPPTTKIYRCSSLHIKWSRSVLVVCPLYPWTPSLRWKIVQVFIGKKIHIISGPMQCKTMLFKGQLYLPFITNMKNSAFQR